MRIFWVSAFIGCTTGYGVMSREICTRLADSGFEVYNVADFSPQGMPWGLNLEVTTEKGNPIKILASTQQGANVLPYFVKKYKPDVIVVFWDPFNHLRYLSSIKTPKLWYTPVDGPLTEKSVATLNCADYIVAYSKYGYLELSKFFPKSRISLIYHGIDRKVFKPLCKSRCRQKFNIPEDKVVFLSIFANLGTRKQIPQMLEAFSYFAKDKDDVLLYLHTNSADYPFGYDLDFIARSLRVRDKVVISSSSLVDPIDDEEIAELINAADWYVCSSESEGFCIPLLQSISCEVPVIAIENSAQLELAEECGIISSASIDYANYPLYVPYHTRYKPPSIPSLVASFEYAYKITHTEKYNELRKSCRKKAEKYDWNRIFPKWIDTLKMVEEDFKILNQVIL